MTRLFCDICERQIKRNVVSERFLADDVPPLHELERRGSYLPGQHLKRGRPLHRVSARVARIGSRSLVAGLESRRPWHEAPLLPCGFVSATIFGLLAQSYAAPKVFGISDPGFASNWPSMAARFQATGASQAGVWVDYCKVPEE